MALPGPEVPAAQVGHRDPRAAPVPAAAAAAAVRVPDLRVAPAPSSPAVRDRFRRQGRRDTVPELAVRRLLHARGVRYRVDVRPCRETRARGDLVWKARRLVVFVDGCFWHACPTCGHLPTVNGAWWAAKLTANVERDRRTDAVLTGLGWRVLRFWEHEPPEQVADAICRALGR